MNKHTSTSLAALEDLQWPLAGLDIPPESSASKTNTAPKSSSDTGPMCQSSETSETLTAGSGAEQTSSQEDFLANLSVKPGSDEARKMTVRSGLKCSELLKRQDPISCLQRMLLASSTWHSTMCFLNWKAKGTPQGRLYFQLAPSTPRTDETECGLWPTPSAGMHKQDVNDSGRYARDIKEKGFQIMLPAAVKLWPTPAARDYKGARKPETMEKTGRNSETNSLPDSVEFREASGRLNPMWVEWLMGYPLGHTDLNHSETPSSRK